MSYPKPAFPYYGHSDLYFATEDRVRSFGLANSDRGEISVSPRRVTFRGMRVLVECSNVVQVNLVRKMFPWLIAGPMCVFAAVMVYVNSPVPMTWRQPLPYVAGACLLFATVTQMNERWVEVVSQEGDQLQRAYFRRNFYNDPLVSYLRTRRLYLELRRALVAQDQERLAEPDAAPDTGRV